ncbi:hypothetical protein Gohar_011116 [Gossypium harknessii]|uniref:Uncharacterized protein n=1 Tax=Gossypium harknessii TaxID=34285 RepID=A0A7J9GSZ3_9ROSI|nr:hypothetical protein [Gossypium harknessii]
MSALEHKGCIAPMQLIQLAFLVPGLPDRIELTKALLPNNLNPGSMWLESWPQSSMSALELIELALGLEASNRPFIRILGEGYKSDDNRRVVDSLWLELSAINLAKEAFENKGSPYLIVKRPIKDMSQISGRNAEA